MSQAGSASDLQPINVAAPRVPERDLWSSVLLQALDDLRCGTRVEWKKVNEWIMSPDFRRVCAMAGVDPLRTAEKMRSVSSERKPRKTNGNRARPVTDLDTGEVWESIAECADHLDAAPQHLRLAIKWHRRIRGRRISLLVRRRR